MYIFIILIITLVLSLMVISARNPVNAVLFLVSVFVMTAIIFIILGAEFFAVLLFTVYVGAIAILFLFVVMMFNLRLIDLYGKTYYHMPSGYLLSIIQILLFIFVIIHDYNLFIINNILNYKIIYINNETNIRIIGSVLYNFCLDYFMIIALVLFIAMVGVIAMTLDKKPKVKINSPNRKSRQNVWWVNIQLVIK